MKLLKNLPGWRCHIFLFALFLFWAAISQSQPILKWPNESSYNEYWEFTPNGNKILVGIRNCSTKRIWDIKTGSLITLDTGCPFGDTGIEFQPNGNLALTSFYFNDSIRIWDINSGKVKYLLKGNYGEFSPDGNLILTSSPKSDSTMIWDASTGKLMYSRSGAYSEFSRDGKWIFNSIDIQGPDTVKINIIETITGKIYRSYIDNNFNDFLVSGDSKYLIVSSYYEQKCPHYEQKIINISSGKQVSSLMFGGYYGYSPQISPDNKWIIFQHLLFGKDLYMEDGRWRQKKWKVKSKLFQLSTGKLIKTFNSRCCECPYQGIPHPVEIHFSPDGKYFLKNIDFKNPALVESATGKLLFKLKKPWDENVVFDLSVKFSKNGNLIATSQADRTKIWDNKTGKQIWDIEGYIWDFHPYLPLLLIGNDEMCTIVSSSSGKPLISFDYIGLNDWVVLHPSGLFDASPWAMEKLYFDYDDEEIELSKLKDKYYEPGLWEKVMSGETIRAIEN